MVSKACFGVLDKMQLIIILNSNCIENVFRNELLVIEIFS